jgi:hypothetical protein
MTPELTAYLLAVKQSDFIFVVSAAIGAMAGAALYVMPSKPTWIRRVTVALILVLYVIALVLIGLVYAQAA